MRSRAEAGLFDRSGTDNATGGLRRAMGAFLWGSTGLAYFVWAILQADVLKRPLQNSQAPVPRGLFLCHEVSARYLILSSRCKRGWRLLRCRCPHEAVAFASQAVAKTCTEFEDGYTLDMNHTRIARWGIPIIFTIIVALYVMMVSAFFAYIWRENQAAELHRQTIAKCLDSGGHIGRGDTCWHVSPNENNQVFSL